MTDLKTLLDQAAGDEPVLTDADLTADLLRGRRSLRRRKAAIGTTTVIASVAVAGAAWSMVPGGSPAESPVAGGPRPAGSTSAMTTTPSAHASADRGTVGLEASGKPLPGARLWCDLKPAGWTVKIRVPRSDEVAALTFLPPGGGDGLPERQAWLALARHSASEPGVGGIRSATPQALLHFDEQTQLRWTNSCHEVR